MKANETYELIDQYLIGKLSEEERNAFENQVWENQELKDLLQKQQFANELIIENRLRGLKGKITSDIQSGIADKMIIRKKLFRGLRWGIGMVALSISGFLLYETWDNHSLKNESTLGIQESSKQETHRNETSTPIVNNNSHKENKNEPNKSKGDLIIDIINHPTDNSENNSIENNSVGDFKIDTNLSKNNATIVEEEKSNACATTNITVSGKPTETCIGKEEGILYLKITGGTPPYKYGIRRNGAKDITWKSNGATRLDQLASGNYQITVEDKNGCINSQQEQFLIPIKNCSVNQADEYAFRPEYSEDFKLDSEKEGTITIYDPAGRQIFQSTITTDRTFVWEGMDVHGKVVDKGLYMFLIEYKDGNSKKGYITVY